MKNDDLYESREFAALLHNYEKAKLQGTSLYLDSDDFVDIAEYYMENGSISKMLDVAEDGLSLHPDDEYLLSLKINALISMHRFDDAALLLDSINPKTDHDVYYFRAQLACAVDGDDGKATELFRKWLKLERNECDSMKNKEEGYNRFKDAVYHVIISFSDLSVNPDVQSSIDLWTKEYVDLFSPLDGDNTDMDVARSCHDAELIEREIEVYTQCLDNNPYIPQGWTYLASLQNVQGHIEDSLNSAENALAIDPDDLQAILVRAHSCYDLQNYAQSLVDYKRYYNETEDASFFMVMGSCAMHIGQKEEGFELLKKAREFCTRHSRNKEEQAYNRAYISDSLALGGFFKEALTMINLALRPFPENPNFLLQKGNILLSLDRIKMAVDTYSEAAKCASPKIVPTVVMAGCELMDKGYLRAAILFFNMALKAEDEYDSVTAYAYLAYIYYLLKETEPFQYNLECACMEVPFIVKALWGDNLIGVDVDDYYEFINKLYKKRIQ
ncbi:MAG: hypothetical protein MJY81_04240 [Bacteroidaceae bacterium]|nr:hypothetical protein [Bacteroidaceae bacterium]